MANNPVKQQKLLKSEKDSPLHGSGEQGPNDTMISNIYHPEPRNNKILWFQERNSISVIIHRKGTKK